MQSILLVFALSMAAALLATPVLVRVVTARGLLGASRPGAGGAAQAVPRFGGVAVFAATAAGLLAAMARGGAAPGFFPGILTGASILFAAGLLDDARGLSPREKVLAQCAAALAAYAWGFRVEAIGFGGGAGDAGVPVGWLALPLTVLWIVGVTNAFNLIDGLDGLATGIALVALATTFVVSLVLGNGDVALVCAALGGALLGFLRYNVRPARIFLGDSGSLLVGFLLAVLSVHGSTKSATAVLAAVVPVMVLALPLADTVLAIGRRWLRGVPVWGADERHLHHRLIAIGLTHRRAVMVLCLAASALAALGLVLAFAPPRVVAVTAVAGAVALAALFGVGVNRLQYHEFAEAGATLASASLRLRRSIQDQIHARDVATLLHCAESLAALRAILSDNAAGMGFLSLELCRAGDEDRARLALPSTGGGYPAWKLEYPVDAPAADGEEGWVLRVWCHQENGFRLLGTERAVRILSEAIGEWSRERAGVVVPLHEVAGGPEEEEEEQAAVGAD